MFQPPAQPLVKHLEAIQAFLRLQDVRGLLGLVNFYRRFIPVAAKILLPLTSTGPTAVSGSAGGGPLCIGK